MRLKVLKCISAITKNCIAHIEYYLEARHHGIQLKAGNLDCSPIVMLIATIYSQIERLSYYINKLSVN